MSSKIILFVSKPRVNPVNDNRTHKFGFKSNKEQRPLFMTIETWKKIALLEAFWRQKNKNLCVGMDHWQALDDGLYPMHAWGSGSGNCHMDEIRSSGQYCSSEIRLMKPFSEEIQYTYETDSYNDSWWPTGMMSTDNLNLNEDIAIRRFCAARLEDEQHQRFESVAITEMESTECCGVWSSSESSSSPFIDSAEQDEMVDSFINMDSCDANPSQSINAMLGTGNGESTEAEITSDDQVVSEYVIEKLDEENNAYQMVKCSSDTQNDQEMQESVGNREQMDKAGEVADEGLQLVHLLLACAEAVGCRDTQLAGSILQQIWMSAHPCGDSLQRVTCCFASGLTSRLSVLLQNLSIPSDNFHPPTKAERAEGFHLLYQCTPYIAFGFMAANEAIGQAAQGKQAVHIVDLGMVQALQWPALIRTLASRPEGPPNLRITGIGSSSEELNEWGAKLTEEAKSFGVPFEFRGISEPLIPSLLNPTSLGLREGETLVINSVLHLHKYVRESRGSLKSILQALHRLNPSILTLVEQDANHNGPFFLGRFLESLHYYSAIFDSLEASLPRSSPQRIKVERFHFAEEIRNIVACEGPDRFERHERADQWRRQLGRSGFQAIPLRFMSQARMMLSVYGCDGYSLAEEKCCLLLGWKGRAIMLASAWRPHGQSS
eukprot:Gb_08892 [translate_table: standard]